MIRASYLEIYNENVRDLLGKDSKLQLDLHVRDIFCLTCYSLESHSYNNKHKHEGASGERCLRSQFNVERMQATDRLRKAHG